jgi:hypothetical protein
MPYDQFEFAGETILYLAEHQSSRIHVGSKQLLVNAPRKIVILILNSSKYNQYI